MYKKFAYMFLLFCLLISACSPKPATAPVSSAAQLLTWTMNGELVGIYVIDMMQYTQGLTIAKGAQWMFASEAVTGGVPVYQAITSSANPAFFLGEATIGMIYVAYQSPEGIRFISNVASFTRSLSGQDLIEGNPRVTIQDGRGFGYPDGQVYVIQDQAGGIIETKPVEVLDEATSQYLTTGIEVQNDPLLKDIPDIASGDYTAPFTLVEQEGVMMIQDQAASNGNYFENQGTMANGCPRGPYLKFFSLKIITDLINAFAYQDGWRNPKVPMYALENSLLTELRNVDQQIQGMKPECYKITQDGMTDNLYDTYNSVMKDPVDYNTDYTRMDALMKLALQYRITPYSDPLQVLNWIFDKVLPVMMPFLY